ncbi:nuclear RNA export factor 1 isoform X2 [Aethina tumida]|uniref:nuclear RNA export factor 1 isoform X2 n=1 Tax=Aethina tumida TaxID=116153 RepID=UPI00096B4064|nr:nuclear RNA export factor 1 isoform X2 [Aethina tumida]
MPKPGAKYNEKPSWKGQYEEPEMYRKQGGGNGGRRVKFKQGRFGHKSDYQKKDWSETIRAHLEEEDIDMGGAAGVGTAYRNNKKFGKGGGRNKGGRRSGSPVPMRRKLVEGATSWYRVSVNYGDKYEKSFLQKLFLDNLNPLPFIPIQWTTIGHNVVFFVEGYKVAEKILSLDRQLQLPDGFKLFVRVQPGSPNVDVTPTMKEKMKLAMGKRYDSNMKSLNLSAFHTDPDLQDMFCALFKPIVFIAVLDIIVENIPQLEALNLDDNKICILSFMKKIVKSLPNLSVLHMRGNKIRDIAHLDPLIGLPIVDLVLEGNPVCDKFKDRTSYISEVRKRFPKVLKLDGVDLEPPISFDIQDEIKIPPSKQTFLCNTEGEAIVRQFLAQYYQLYDSENREPLMQAYHEEATLSITMAYPYGYNKDKDKAWLNWYNTDNRNIMKVDDRDRRFKLLKQGKQAVCTFLNEMPKTKHDIHSFTVDLTLFTPVMLSLTVTGMFKELKSGHKIPPLRHFFRTMVIVPAGGGFCIINDELHVTNATQEQAKKAFKLPDVPAVTANPVDAPAPQVPLQPSDDLKQQMISRLCQETRMNPEWSMKCLMETNWNEVTALAAFRELHIRNAVPPEAFIVPT